MIVVSLKRSYPNLIADLDSPSVGVVEYRLEGITRGNWPAMRAELIDGYLDYVVGTWDGVIVSAYPTNAVEVLSDGRIKFGYEEDETSKPVDAFTDRFERMSVSNNSGEPAEWLIGCPMPGGPWRQGEARGTRRYDLDSYLADYPELAARREEDFGGRMAMNLLAHHAGQRAIDVEDYPALTPAGAHEPVTLTPAAAADVTVVRQPGGTVVVTIPTGTRAQILIEP
jgi:hypothetical protein